MEKKYALLIDAENTSSKYIDKILKAIEEKNITMDNIVIRRIYGDWSSPNIIAWRDVSLQYTITPVQHFSFVPKKNSTDFAMVIDAMDFLHSGDVNGFLLVTSDSDFTKLAMRIKEAGMTVYGFGKAKTPRPFIASCDDFIVLDDGKEKAPAQKPAAKSAQKPAAKPAEKAPAKKAESKPAAKPAQKPAAKPAAKPAEKAPAKKAESKPATKPTQKPAAKPTIKPAEKAPAKKVENKPAQKPAPKPAAKPAQKPTQKPAPVPAKTAAKPAEKPAAKPAEKAPAKKAEGVPKAVVKPAQKTVSLDRSYVSPFKKSGEGKNVERIPVKTVSKSTEQAKSAPAKAAPAPAAKPTPAAKPAPAKPTGHNVEKIPMKRRTPVETQKLAKDSGVTNEVLIEISTIVDGATSDGSWLLVSRLGKMLKENVGFDCQEYGYGKFSKLLKTLGYETEYDKVRMPLN